MSGGFGSELSDHGSTTRLPSKKLVKKKTKKAPALERMETKKSTGMLPAGVGAKSSARKNSNSSAKSSISGTSKSPAPHRRSDMLQPPLPTIL